MSNQDKLIDNQALISSKNSKKRSESTGHMGTLSNVAIMDSLTNTIKRHGRQVNQNTESIVQEINEAKRSFIQLNQTTSIQTIFAITNTMVGSVCLVVPQVFLNDGIFTCLIVMVILGFVQYKTCYLMIAHQRAEEIELEETITRILGRRWNMAFRISSGTLLFIVGVVYFLLINSTLYPILEFIFIKTGYTNYVNSKTDHAITFDKFSPQYLGMILFIPLGFPLFIRDITKLIKLAEFGIVAIISYSFFVIYIFIKNIADGTVADKIGEMNYFTSNFNEPAGQFALAFMVHNTIGPLMKTNKIKSNNARDLGIAYTLAATIYGSIGVFGSFGILGKKAIQPSTILDYFDPEDISVLIIETLFLAHLLSAFPIFNFVSRSQILDAIYPDQDYPEWMFYAFSAFHLIACLTTQLLQLNPGMVISFDGAVCGFFLIYIIPITLHFKCYYGKSDQRAKVRNTSHESHTGVIDSVNSPEAEQKTLGCVSHPDKDRVSKLSRYIFYGIFFCVGIANLVIQLKSLFKPNS